MSYKSRHESTNKQGIVATSCARSDGPWFDAWPPSCTSFYSRGRPPCGSGCPQSHRPSTCSAFRTIQCEFWRECRVASVRAVGMHAQRLGLGTVSARAEDAAARSSSSLRGGSSNYRSSSSRRLPNASSPSTHPTLFARTGSSTRWVRHWTPRWRRQCPLAPHHGHGALIRASTALHFPQQAIYERLRALHRFGSTHSHRSS
jgi:hypothetical protein